MNELVITARWIVPVSSPPMERGTVTVRGERISAVDSYGGRTADVDLGNVAIIPGLVNSHVHLDLSGLAGKVPPSADFCGWLKAIIAHRRTQSPAQIEADIRAGLAKALSFGTTTLGDIAGGGSSLPILRDASCTSIVYHELLGLSAQRAQDAWLSIGRLIRDHADNDRCMVGLSPHAPYSVHHSLFRAAGRTGLPLATHLAETREEQQLLDDHTGPFADFLQEVGAWEEDALVPSHDWLLWRCGRAPSLLLAHGNYLDTVIPSNATVVYCPRTHAAFGHEPHPFREMLRQGVRVALGTDSLASNPDLDLLAEVRFVAEHYPEVPREQLLRMATLNGAEGMGLGSLTGSLQPGKYADLVAVPLPDRDEADVHELIVEYIDGKRQTMWRGMW